MPIKPITFNESDLRKLFRSNTPVARITRWVKRVLRGLIYFVVLFAIFFYGINAPAFYQRFSFTEKPPLVAEQSAPFPVKPVVTYSPEIIIEKLGIKAPVSYDTSYNDILTSLRDGVVRYEGTANPGQIGNVVILGHSSDFPWSTGSYKTIFALLDKLVVGDQIVLPFGTERYIYKVTETKVVKATDLTVLNRTAEPTLTLITCYPVGTALKRLVIRALLAGDPVGSIQTTEPYLGDKLVTVR